MWGDGVHRSSEVSVAELGDNRLRLNAHRATEADAKDGTMVMTHEIRSGDEENLARFTTGWLTNGSAAIGSAP